jgi:hypothetical protein
VPQRIEQLTMPLLHHLGRRSPKARGGGGRLAVGGWQWAVADARSALAPSASARSEPQPEPGRRRLRGRQAGVCAAWRGGVGAGRCRSSGALWRLRPPMSGGNCQHGFGHDFR